MVTLKFLFDCVYQILLIRLALLVLSDIVNGIDDLFLFTRHIGANEQRCESLTEMFKLLLHSIKELWSIWITTGGIGEGSFRDGLFHIRLQKPESFLDGVHDLMAARSFSSICSVAFDFLSNNINAIFDCIKDMVIVSSVGLGILLELLLHFFEDSMELRQHLISDACVCCGGCLVEGG